MAPFDMWHMGHADRLHLKQHSDGCAAADGARPAGLILPYGHALQFCMHGLPIVGCYEDPVRVQQMQVGIQAQSDKTGLFMSNMDAAELALLRSFLFFLDSKSVRHLGFLQPEQMCLFCREFVRKSVHCSSFILWDRLTKPHIIFSSFFGFARPLPTSPQSKCHT
jgi:hypothetical protein